MCFLCTFQLDRGYAARTFFTSTIARVPIWQVYVLAPDKQRSVGEETRDVWCGMAECLGWDVLKVRVQKLSESHLMLEAMPGFSPFIYFGTQGMWKAHSKGNTEAFSGNTISEC